MSKKNFVFGIGGLLLGCVIGFMFANYVNRNGSDPSGLMTNPTVLPPSHPESNDGASLPQVQAVIDKAEAEPDNFEAQTKAAAMFYQIQRFDRAIEFLRRANGLRPDDYRTIVSLGNAHFDSNQFEEAEKWYSAVLAKNADDPDVRTDLGLTFLLRQPPDYDRAVREFTSTLKKDPKHPQALQNLTIAFIKKGDAARANETLARLEILDATNPALSKLREDIQKMESK